MPIYLFKCQKCKKEREIIIGFGEFDNLLPVAAVGSCQNKKCQETLYKSDQQINFTGGINMNSTAVGVAKRKYSNKAGGPRPFVNGKFKPDMKPNW